MDSNQRYQFDLSYGEQDKIKRRLDLKNRLKEEAIRKKFSPFAHLNKEHYTDPAVDRFMDLRKKGRMPGAPLKASFFFGMTAALVIPYYALLKLAESLRKPYLEAIESGETRIEDRIGKAIP